MKTGLIKNILALILLSIDLGAGFELYTVKKGDTVSQILYNKGIKGRKNLYGKNGGVEKTISLNEEKLRPNKGNLIYPSMKIYLPINGTEIEKKKFLENPMAFVEKEMTPKNLPQHILRKPSSVPEDKTPVVQPLITHPQVMYREEEKVSHSKLNFFLINQFMRVDTVDTSTNTTASLLSDSGMGAKVVWDQMWEESIHTYLSTNFLKVTIAESSTATKTLTNRPQTLQSYNVGFKKFRSDRFTWVGEFEYSESIVSRSVDSSTLRVEKFRSPKFIGGVSYKLLSRDELSLTPHLKIIAAMPTKQESYDSSLSMGTELGLNVKDYMGGFQVNGEVFYRDLNYKMTGGEFRQLDLGLMIGITKNFEKTYTQKIPVYPHQQSHNDNRPFIPTVPNSGQLQLNGGQQQSQNNQKDDDSDKNRVE